MTEENAMTENDKLQMFEDRPIRTAWDETQEEWYFSIVDVVTVLTESGDYNTVNIRHVFAKCADSPRSRHPEIVW